MAVTPCFLIRGFLQAPHTAAGIHHHDAPTITALDLLQVRADLDLGIVGRDMFEEIAAGSPDLIILHNALDFGHCHLALGVPTSGRFAGVDSLQVRQDMAGSVTNSYLQLHQEVQLTMNRTASHAGAEAAPSMLLAARSASFRARTLTCAQALRDMPEWSVEHPLRVVTGYQSIARRFFADAGFEHVVLLAADGALEAHPAMGSADIILDLVRAPGRLPAVPPVLTLHRSWRQRPADAPTWQRPGTPVHARHAPRHAARRRHPTVACCCL